MTEEIATREAYGKALVELGQRMEKIVVLDADLSNSTRTVLFAEKFPLRFFNMGISEADMMGTAAGLAASGFIPFVSTFGVFATGRAYDQVRNSIAYTKLNVKIVATHTGITVGEDGASHQALEDIALMRVLPNMTVVVPADGRQTYQAVEAIARCSGPVYLRLGRPKVPVVIPEGLPFELGKAQLLKDGKDLAFIATGITVKPALEAAKLLESEKISAAVVNMHTIKPLDKELLLEMAQKTGTLVTVEEHSVIGGLGSAVAELVSENFPVPVIRVGINDTFGESGTPEALLKKYGLTAENLILAGKAALQKKKEI
ncbi:MAG TPA: transketolase [Firmicutes bacterium]|nr:transketolase family protein [Bacillota bacterium]HAA33863.1 transketolase [Bacillota bacterium]